MKFYNFDNNNANVMYSSPSTDYDKKACSNGRDASCGTALKQSATISILGDKNGIKLMMIEATTTRFELYMDDDLLNIFYNRKTAVAMFKDFSA